MLHPEFTLWSDSSHVLCGYNRVWAQSPVHNVTCWVQGGLFLGQLGTMMRVPREFIHITGECIAMGAKLLKHKILILYRLINAWTEWLTFYKQNFKCIFLILIKISLKFAAWDPTDNKSALVQLVTTCGWSHCQNQRWPSSLTCERERERLSLSAFLRTEDIGVHIVHISRLIITYTLE